MLNPVNKEIDMTTQIRTLMEIAGDQISLSEIEELRLALYCIECSTDGPLPPRHRELSSRLARLLVEQDKQEQTDAERN